MWSIYVAEADKFDKTLVDSWRGDMEGILIFAGLFSASLTAFIIESYKKLSRDSGDATVALLAQISSQLSNGTNLGIPTPSPANTPFQPTPSAVIVNILWFLSLALALVCALCATMVEQWARNYLQLIERRPAPHKRARIRAYLYEGITTFRMTAVVEAIPTLLHVSLFLFFIGLVTFLFPIDLCVALPILIILVTVVGLYAVITFLPMVSQNCPYQTPLSPTCWHILQWLNLLRYRDSSGSKKPIRGSIADGRERLATEAMRKRDERDQVALRWMLKFLTSDSELEQFLNAIPNFLRTDHSNRLHTIIALESDFHGKRIWGLLDRCREHVGLEVARRRRRSVICMAALRTMVTNRTWLPAWFSYSHFLTMAALQKDTDSVISTVAICTSVTILSACLSAFTIELPFKSLCCKNSKDEQLLMQACDLLPVDVWAASRPESDSLISPAERSSHSLEGALLLLRNEVFLDAVLEWCLYCEATRCSSRGKFILGIFEISAVKTDGLSRSLRWLSDDIIRDAKEALHYLRNPDGDSNGWPAKRAVSGMLCMLHSMKTKKTPDELSNFGHLVIINALISKLMQNHHDTCEHSATVMETLQQIIQPNFSPNDADLETQTKFLRLMADAVSRNPPPLSFPVAQVLLRLLKLFEHPTSIASAIHVIDGNTWLHHNGFPLEESLTQLRENLSRRTEEVALERLITSPMFSQSPGSVHRPEGVTSDSSTRDCQNGEQCSNVAKAVTRDAVL